MPAKSHLTILFIVIAFFSSQLAVGAVDYLSNAGNQAAGWTPVLINNCFAPRPFLGSEQQWHLVYDLTLSNFARDPAKISRFEIFGQDAAGKWSSVQVLDSEKVKALLLPITQTEASSTLAPGAVSPLFINIDFDHKEQVPLLLRHELTYESKALGTLKTYKTENLLTVENEPAVRISSPLRGGKWVAVGGYVGTEGHRRALFAIDNALHSAQLFAIDWVRLDEHNFTCNDPTKNEGSACYGQPVQAVGDGKIYSVVNRFEDQKPQQCTGEDRLYFPGGNSLVQDIGHGYYALYAHLKPGSIKVAQGEVVKRGQELAQLGNSGNTTGPHLHLHITRNPGILQADGVPYVFDHFDVLGQIDDINTFIDNDCKGKMQHYAESKFKGVQHDQLIRDGFIVNFAAESK